METFELDQLRTTMKRRIVLIIISVAFVVYYWSAVVKINASDLKPTIFSRLLTLSTIFHTVLMLPSSLNIVLFFFLVKPVNEDGTAQAQVWENHALVKILRFVTYASGFALFAINSWASYLIFPTKPCVKDDDQTQFLEGEGCSALHVISIFFVATIGIFIVFSFLACFLIYFKSLRPLRADDLQNYDVENMQRQITTRRFQSVENAVNSMLPGLIRSRIIAVLPQTTKPTITDVCAICLDMGAAGTRWRILPCQHQFHSECVDPYLTSTGLCPMCRDSIAEYADLALEDKVEAIENDEDTATEVEHSSIPSRAARYSNVSVIFPETLPGAVHSPSQ